MTPDALGFRKSYRLADVTNEERTMSLTPTATDEGQLEECVDLLDELVNTWDRYPEVVIACALRIHLGALLRAMADNQVCSREDVRQFVLELEHQALGVNHDL